MIKLQRKDFNVNEVISRVRGNEVGATVIFIGSVRDHEIKGIEFEVYRRMALRKLKELEQSVKDKFNVIDMAIIHRTGKLRAGENIVIVAVSASHRKEAFSACRFCIDGIKRIVPIWKTELKE